MKVDNEGRVACALYSGEKTHMEITGIVLAGGRSRRLGRDKCVEPLDGRTLLERALDALEQVCAEVVVVTAGGDPPGRIPSRPGLRLAHDVPPARGPVTGMVAGLRAASHPYAVAVACDAPFLQPPLLAWLTGACHGYDATVPRLQGQPQVLCACYARDACLPYLERLLDEGRLALHGLLPLVRVRWVEEAEAREHDPDLLSFRNVNTPEELAEAEALARGLKMNRGPSHLP